MIMLIDDEIEILEMMRLFFRKYGEEAIIFDDSIKALEYFRENYKLVSLVISDYDIPEMKGDKLLLEMIKIDSKVKFIFLSGKLEEIPITFSMAMNIKGMKRKPLFEVGQFVSNCIGLVRGEQDKV